MQLQLVLTSADCCSAAGLGPYKGQILVATGGNFFNTNSPAGVALLDPEVGNWTWLTTGYFGLRYNNINDLIRCTSFHEACTMHACQPCSRVAAAALLVTFYHQDSALSTVHTQLELECCAALKMAA